MTDGKASDTLSGIAALPPSTVRQLGSHQLLTDPSSVVKELIDNSLDARAKNIFVDITANTIDSVQVKDDGHGIPNEDRALACRRYCTSKIRDFHDLKEVGGKWLGFRGEALASVVDMSGKVLVTTRVEGEPVAVKLTYQRDGELTLTERDSHPVGTTIKVTKLLDSTKVRREVAINGSARCLARIRRLMQAYALARPAIRLRLHVLKAKNNKSDFNYAPKPNASVEDAAFKVIGKECALQCAWTAIEMDGFELHAFLPKTTAIASQIANHGAFLSVDFRPVSAMRGTFKKIAANVRNRLRKLNAMLANVKDPFFCMNLTCPVDSYDPNIEPAKDDVIFENEGFVIALVERLLISFYPMDISSPASIEGTESTEAVTTPPHLYSHVQSPFPRPHTDISVDQDSPAEKTDASSLVIQNHPARWRSSMYGIDEEDLEFLQRDTSVAIEEEEDSRDVTISNPWTIARMNTLVKPRKLLCDKQLPSPAKSPGAVATAPESPTPGATPPRPRTVEPLTPLATPQVYVPTTRYDEDSQRSPQHLQMNKTPNSDSSSLSSVSRLERTPHLASFDTRMPLDLVRPTPQKISIGLSGSTADQQKPSRKRRAFRNKAFVPPASRPNDTWFGQAVNTGPRALRVQEHPVVSCEDHPGSQGAVIMPELENSLPKRLTAKTNSDVRGFFDKLSHGPAMSNSPLVNPALPPHDIAEPSRAYEERESVWENSLHGPQYVEARPCSADLTREMKAVFDLHQNTFPKQILGPACTFQVDNPAVFSTPHPQHRGLHRTTSACLPLNFVPHGFETHALSLTINTKVSALVQQARRLDMAANSLEWGYDTTDAFDVFGTPISERKIMDWVINVDDMLHAVCERVDGVEVRGALHEGIQRFLDMRKEEDDHNKNVEEVRIGDLTSCEKRDSILQDVDNGTISLTGASSEDIVPKWLEEMAVEGAVVKCDEHARESASPQVIDPGDEGQESPVRVIKTEDEFGDGINDDMLMDL